MSRILVVDDEAQIRRFLRISLSANGHEVVEAETGAEAIARAQADPPPDLVILDLGLPDMDGQEVISAIREVSRVPILVLSVRAGEVDKVEALDRGAEDYVAKPFGIAELMARVRVALRRSPKVAETVLRAGPLELDIERRRILRHGAEIRLSRREQELLFHLARHPDTVLTHHQILKAVWGPAHVDDTAYLRVYINQLRQKLEDDPSQPCLLVTEPGVGYRLRTEPAG